MKDVQNPDLVSLKNMDSRVTRTARSSSLMANNV